MEEEKKKSILEGLGIEAVFIGIVILVIIGVLSYLNIIPLKNFIPSFNTNHKSIKPVPATLISTNPTLSSNPLLLQKAKEDLPVFIKASLQPNLIPSSFDIQPLKNANNQILDPNRLLMDWKGNTYAATAIERYNNTSNEIEYRQIFITLPDKQVNLDATSAAQTSTAYFTTTTKGDWKCSLIMLNDKDNKKAFLCENFWIDENKVKNGIGIISDLPNRQGSSVFSCQLFPASNFYKENSCFTEFANINP